MYFAILIYSYAIHLRKGSYRSLPRTTDSVYSQYATLNGSGRGSQFPESVLGDYDEEAGDDFYRMPVASAQQSTSRIPAAHGKGSSIGSFTDFVSAPGRGRRFRPKGTAGLGGPNVLGAAPAGKTNMPDKDVDFVDEVLFDSDELTHSKFGTDETTSVSSRDEEASGRRTPAERAPYSRERSGYLNSANQ